MGCIFQHDSVIGCLEQDRKNELLSSSFQWTMSLILLLVGFKKNIFSYILHLSYCYYMSRLARIYVISCSIKYLLVFQGQKKLLEYLYLFFGYHITSRLILAFLCHIILQKFKYKYIFFYRICAENIVLLYTNYIFFKLSKYH